MLWSQTAVAFYFSLAWYIGILLYVPISPSLKWGHLSNLWEFKVTQTVYLARQVNVIMMFFDAI